MNSSLAKLRKTIQKGLSSPDRLFWKFDSRDRGGSPYQVFLDLEYKGRTASIEWFWAEPDKVSLVTGVEKPIELNLVDAGQKTILYLEAQP